jgi:hypothetical protein
MIHDRCSVACEPNQINLNALTFMQLAPLNLGNISVQFRQVRLRG